MQRPMRVGLTGGIASGKSTVADRFAELGVPVIDADLAARRVVAPGTPGLEAVAGRFGSSLLLRDGTLDRSSLRRLVFADPAARHALEAILHPLIRADMERAASGVNYPYVVMAIPLLIEGGAAKERVERVLVVDIPEELQFTRLLQRDGGARGEAHAILESQAKRAARLAVADDVLDNSGNVAELRHAVDVLHQQYLQMAPQMDPRTN